MLKGFVVDLIKSRELILDLVKRDYKQQHQGSYLGLLWNYLQPILFIAVLYTVFTLGLRTGREIDGMPFSLYLISGMVCWLYFTANLTAITSVIRNYRFLVKKVDFRLSILPMVKLLSSLAPHVFLLLITILIATYNNILPGWHSLQLLYYYCCMVTLLLGLGWLTSSTSLFVKDVSNLVALITQFGFWLTPIFWHIDAMPEKLQWILKLNPAYYLVTGYRDAITGETFFWQRPQETLIFWGITLTLVICGAMVFKKLKPHFAEVI
jgi:lipopolysaccharide transport system permease protein/teichoic acid transport system permease protein